MSKRIEKRKERDRRVKKTAAKEKHRRASQPPPPPMPAGFPPNLGITLHFVGDDGEEIGSETLTLFDGLKVPR